MSLRTVTRTRRWIAGAGALAATFPAFTLAQIPKPGQDDDDAQLASGESYTSPELGFTVEWGEPWVELERSAADSFATMGEESITLNATGFDGFLGLYAIDPARDAASPAGLVAFYGDLADRKLANEPPTTAALIERSDESFTALFLVEYGDGGLMYEFWELRVDPGSDYATYVLLAGPADAFGGFFEIAQSAITMNGDTPFTAVSDDEILTAAENGTGTGIDHGDDATTGVDDAVLTVRDHFDELRPTVSELAELTGIESLTEAEADRFNQIVELWIAAPTFAAGVDLPDDHAAIGDAYLAYTANLGTAGEAIVTIFTPDIPEDEFDAAERDLGTAIDADADLATTLDDLLTAAGA